MSTELRFTIHDLELLPENGNRYEVIDGELYVATQPHALHQYVCTRLGGELDAWSRQGGTGLTLAAPGVIFAEDDAVAPDLVWVRRERLAHVVWDDGKLHAAPDLVVEVLSPGPKNEERDRDIKLKLYSRQGVREYWIVDWRDLTVRVYRREQAHLHLVATHTAEDTLTSPLLPGFALRVGDLRPPLIAPPLP
ncbi:MAG: Uma2 family endonuclease [Chloroflexi bacterium]|nr:Uma2 family endonuclease [Chloroflexota bacterium]